MVLVSSVMSPPSDGGSYTQFLVPPSAQSLKNIKELHNYVTEPRLHIWKAAQWL